MNEKDPEVRLLAKILNDPTFILKVRHDLKPECFHDARHREMYDLCLEISKNGMNVDLELLAAAILSGDGDGKVTAHYAWETTEVGDPGDVDGGLKELRARMPLEKGLQNKQPLDQLLIRGLAEQYANLFASRLESPWGFWAMSFLTVLGAVLSDRLRLRGAIYTEPRFYTVILGESADDRKSEAIKQTVNFFRRHDLLDNLGICYGVGSAEGLASRLEEGRKLLIIFDKFKTFVSKSQIEAAILLPAVNSPFEDRNFESQTKTRKINIRDGSLSILAASTVDTFSKMFSPIFTDIGFLNRLWLIADKSERRHAIPEEIPAEKQESLGAEVKRIISRHEQTRVIGWWVSQLNSAFVSPGSILRAFNDPPHNNLMEVYNSKLGMAYISAENRLTVSDIYPCCGQELMAIKDQGPCAMGIDVGSTLHVIVGVKVKEKVLQILHLARVSSFNDLHDIAQRFNVKCAVIDMEPELRQAREFARSEEYPVFLCDYIDSVVAGPKWDEETRIVKANRTELCDESHHLVANPGRLILPRRNEEMGIFGKQLCNLVKVLQEDPESASREYKYRKVGEDHYRHALNYFFLASQRVPIAENQSWWTRKRNEVRVRTNIGWLDRQAEANRRG